MKKLIILITVLLFGLRSFAFSVLPDSTKVQEPQSATTFIDSLKQQLSLAPTDSVKKILYTQLASQFIQYDTITNKETRAIYQDEAIKYTYLALHLCSRYADTIGTRNCFSNLAKVYRSQKKYVQAKWFIIQSNTISRGIKDVPNIISSLIVMAGIKMEMKDYSLAKRDLNEALNLSKVNRYPRVESKIQLSYVLLYSHLGDDVNEALALKRHNAIEDSIRKAETAALMAKLAKLKTQDSVQNKKKVYSTVSRKVSKSNYSSKRIASL